MHIQRDNVLTNYVNMMKDQMDMAPAYTPAIPLSVPDQWVDWGDVTMTVDPQKNDMWNYDGYDRQIDSAARGRHYEAKHVNDLKSVVDATHVDSNYYLPVLTALSDRFTAPIGAGCHSWRGAKRDPSRLGRLPSITAMVYDNSLQNKSHGEIEREMRESERTRHHRLYDRGGIKSTIQAQPL